MVETSRTEGEAARSLRVEPAEAGSRLDRFLSLRLGVSRAQARRLLERGEVSGDGRPLSLRDKGTPLAAGARVEVVAFRRPSAQRIRPTPEAQLAVLAEGKGWLAVDKPAGWPVHPLREDETGCVLNAVAARHPDVQGVGEAGLRSGVVHRLDVDTSGVLIVATDEAVWTELRAAFSAHRVEKVYRAIVAGRLESQLDMELGLVVARHRPARVRVVEPDAKGSDEAFASRQRVRPIEHLDGATLVEVRPRTGFLHQIRATLAHVGHPILGDRTYGSPDAPAAPRHMLHASELRWRDIDARAGDPRDFLEALAGARSSG